jgi:hypothetical protein
MIQKSNEQDNQKVRTECPKCWANFEVNRRPELDDGYGNVYENDCPNCMVGIRVWLTLMRND